MKLYQFLQDKKWYEDVGHIFIGMIPLWGWLREHKQWPPGDIMYAESGVMDTTSFDEATRRLEEMSWPIECAPLDRVQDSYRDFLGYAIGETIRTVILLVLLLT